MSSVEHLHAGTSVYLDNNATTKLDPEVIERISYAAEHAWGNPSSPYQQGKLAKQIIESSRQNIADMLNARPEEIIFTSGGTESNHLAILSAVNAFKSSNENSTVKPHVITSVLEHDSVKLLLHKLRENDEIELSEVAACTESARVEVDNVTGQIRPNTCLITIMLANNETGVFQPVSDIFQRVRLLDRQKNRRTRIWLHTDAAQVIGKHRIDLHELETDYLTVVGHKFYGPRIGALYVRALQEGETPLFPLFFGGGQERNYRPGTENTPMIAGLGQAAKLVNATIKTDTENMRRLRDYLERRLEESFSVVAFNGRGEGNERLCNTCNVSILDGGYKGSEILGHCRRLQASVGAACHDQNRVSAILLASGVREDVARSALRLSVGRRTTTEEIDHVIDDLKRSLDKLDAQNSSS